mgnify:CR=1 FL=1
MHLQTHHAHLLLAPRAQFEAEVLPRIEQELGVKAKGNPDFFVTTHETFGIDDAHTLQERATQAAVGAGPKVFAIVTTALTRDAQNALLKLFEDAPRETFFFLIMESAGRLLPTLRSRLFTTRVREVAAPATEARQFPTLSIPERMALLKSYIESEEDSRNRDVQQFLSELTHIYTAVLHTAPTKEHAHVMERLLTLSRYATQTGPSRKMILEELAVILPHP